MKKQTLADLTAPMQSALIHCYGRGVKPFEFTDEGRWSPATLTALSNPRQPLVYLTVNRRNQQVWRATELGSALVRMDDLRLLAARPGRVHYRTLPPRPGKKFGRHAVDDRASGASDYTHLPWEAMRGEPEAA